MKCNECGEELNHDNVGTHCKKCNGPICPYCAKDVKATQDGVCWDCIKAVRIAAEERREMLRRYDWWNVPELRREVAVDEIIEETDRWSDGAYPHPQYTVGKTPLEAFPPDGNPNMGRVLYTRVEADPEPVQGTFL